MGGVNQLRENDFQRFCAILLSLDDPLFQAVNGAGGDLGNDGFLVVGDTLFQAYGPPKPTTSKTKTKINKAIADAARLRRDAFPLLAKVILLTPFDLTQKQHQHLRAKALAESFTSESWGESKLTAKLTKHPSVRQEFSEFLVPDVVGEVRRLDQLVREKAAAPPTFARIAFDDTARFSNGLVWFWQNLYQQAVPGEQPGSVVELFSDTRLSLIAVHLNMDAGPMVTPPRTWWEQFDRHFCEMTAAAEAILQRYTGILDASMYDLVHKIHRDYLKPDGALGIVDALRETDERQAVPKPRSLVHYWRPAQWIMAPIVELHQACRENYDKLTRMGLTGLQRVVDGPSGGQGQVSPPSMISPRALAEQQAEYELWAKDHSFVVGRDPVEWRQVVRTRPIRT